MDVRALLISSMLLLVLVWSRIPPVHAAGPSWQLGWKSSDPSYWYGLESNQQVDGSVPTSDGGFWETTGFYDINNTYWTNIELRDSSDGGNIYVLGEVIAGGTLYQHTLCSSLSTNTYYTDKVLWDFTNGGWAFSSSASGCGSWLAQESGSPHKIDGNGGYDFVESNDNTTSDFSSDKAYMQTDYSLRYMDQYGSWYTPVWVAPYSDTIVAGTMPSIGASYSCTDPQLLLDSDYGGPWRYGSTPTWACT